MQATACAGTNVSHLIDCFCSVEIQSERAEESNISNQRGRTVFCACIICQDFCRSSYIRPWSRIGNEAFSVTGNPCVHKVAAGFLMICSYMKVTSLSIIILQSSEWLNYCLGERNLFPSLVAVKSFSLFVRVKTGSGADPTFKWIGTGGKQGKTTAA